MSARPMIVIMHVPGADPKRDAYVEQMIKDLGDIDHIVAIDPKRHGQVCTVETGLYNAFKKDPTHILVVPDDVILCDNFPAVLRRVLEAKPNEPLCLYNNCSASVAAREEGYSWVTRVSGMVQPTAPTWMWQDYYKWSKEEFPVRALEIRPADTAFELYLNSRRRLFWTPVVSLMEHGDAESLVGNQKDKHRKAEVPPSVELGIINWDTDGIFSQHYCHNVEWLLGAPEKFLVENPIHEIYYDVLRQVPYRGGVDTTVRR